MLRCRQQCGCSVKPQSKGHFLLGFGVCFGFRALGFREEVSQDFTDHVRVLILVLRGWEVLGPIASGLWGSR